jgi:small subunit ribosomal protein S1
LVELSYREGQLISGVVTNVVEFGAFVSLEVGVEGLIHVSELSDPPPDDPRSVLRRGDELVVRILRIEASRRRIGLSLKSVSPAEQEEWLWAARDDTTGLEDGALSTGEAAADEDAFTVSEVSLDDEQEYGLAIDVEQDVLSSVPERV